MSVSVMTTSGTRDDVADGMDTRVNADMGLLHVRDRYGNFIRTYTMANVVWWEE